MNLLLILRRVWGTIGIMAIIAACSPLPPSSEIQIDTGRISGVVVDDIQVFKGIPFAAPPIDDLRWQPPQAAASWTGIRSATNYGPMCAQLNASSLWFDLGDISEDCLTVNVWAPKTDTDQKLPVMVSIHGGGFVQGSGNIERQNGRALAEQGVVLVTVNYRLAMFGFLTHPALAALHPDQGQGNYGLLDVQAALQWVQRNISAFGGDPDNVTIFGTSAGADMVNLLMVMPSAEGLFHRAISQSGSTGLAPLPYLEKRAGFTPPTNQSGIAFAKRIVAADADDVAQALYALNTKEILAGMTEMDRFPPVIDGDVIPDQLGVLFAENKQHKVSYMTGGNSFEAALGYQVGGDAFSPATFSRLVPAEDKSRLYSGLLDKSLDDQIFSDMIVMSASRYIATQMRQAGVPVFSYYLSYVAEARRDSQPGAAHGDDVAFVLKTLESEKNLDSIAGKDREVSDLMSAYWVQFARTGNPNKEGSPEWPAFEPATSKVLEIGDNVIVRERFLSERLDYHISRSLDLLERVMQ